MLKYYRYAILLLVLLWLPTRAAHADADAGTPELFAETGHTLAYAFRAFYDSQGGLAQFGYPLTEVFVEDGQPVQYFERARLEWHADIGLVLGGQLGRWAAQQIPDQAPFQPVTGTDVAGAGADWYVETGHTLRGEFQTYWRAHGGLPVFGFPLSEEFVERNADDGHDYVVQYFERARFEFHP